MAREIERFQATGKDGIYTVMVYELSMDTTHLTSDTATREPSGLLSYKLADGRNLNVRDEKKNEFEIVQTGEILRRI
jgi:hypothetical protein